MSENDLIVLPTLTFFFKFAFYISFEVEPDFP